MDAIIMHSTTSLVSRIKRDHPQFAFINGNEFRWSPDTMTIYIDQSSQDFEAFVLHELGHALLNHKSYHRDIELLKIERDAWSHAVLALADVYNVAIREDVIQDNLDTYREWLHRRSTCPSCTATGLQSSKGLYACLGCGTRWKSNEARNCALRRYSITH